MFSPWLATEATTNAVFTFYIFLTFSSFFRNHELAPL